MSQNTQLTLLEASAHSSITSLDLSQNVLLDTLIFGSCSLDAIDLSQNTALTYLSIESNDLEVLDLSDNDIKKIQGLENLSKLRKINLSRNELTKVENLDNLINLEHILLKCRNIKDYDTGFINKLKSLCIISLWKTYEEKLSSFVPEKIQFDNYRGLPRRLGFAPYKR